MPDLDSMLMGFTTRLRVAGLISDAQHVEAVAVQLRETLSGRSNMDLYDALTTLHDCADSALNVVSRHTQYLPPRRGEP